MDHKFRQFSEQSLDLIEMMVSVPICCLNDFFIHLVCLCLLTSSHDVCVQVNNSTNSTGDAEEENTVAFPLHLYSQASKASVSHPRLLLPVTVNAKHKKS